MLDNKHVVSGEEELEAVRTVLESGRLSGKAPIVGEYESELAEYFGVKHAIAVANGTVSISATLAALGAESGREVILPPTAPIMSVLPILNANMTPVFCDVDQDSFGFDTKDLNAKISKKTVAALQVPMWGYPFDSTKADQSLSAHELPVIEDAAQAHGSRDSEAFVGARATVGSYSTHDRKLICTGEGGFIVTDDSVLAEAVRSYREFGAGSNGYGHGLGSNFKLSAVLAAIGIVQLRRLESRIAAREKIAKQILGGISTLSWCSEIAIPAGMRHNRYALALRTTAEGGGRAISHHLWASGVSSDSRRYDYRPLYDLPVLRPFQSSCPNAESLISRIFTLPCHEGLQDDDVEKIVSAMKSYKPRG